MQFIKANIFTGDPVVFNMALREWKTREPREPGEKHLREE